MSLPGTKSPLSQAATIRAMANPRREKEFEVSGVSPSPLLAQECDPGAPGRRSRLVHRGYMGGAVVALFVAAAYRLLASRDDFWLDEIWSWLIATRVQSALQIFTEIRHDNNHFINSLIIYSLGTDRDWFLYRLPAVAAGICTVVGCGLTARRWGCPGALTAMLITGASFPLIQYSSEARGYAYALLFAIAAFEIVQRSFGKSQLWMDGLFTCCAMLGFLAHLTFVSVYAALVSWSLWRLFRSHGVWSSRHWRVLIWQILVPLAGLAWLYFVNLRHLVVGGGDEVRLATVVTQAISLAVGGPLTEPWAAIVAGVALIAAGVALYQLYRSGSDLWLPFAAGIFVFPSLALLVTMPTVLYPRYFVVSMLFLQLLISWLLVRMFHWAQYGRVLYVLLLAAILAGNAVSTSRLLTYGRGGYQAALRFMLENASDRDLTVGSDHDFRNRLVLEYYFLRSGSPRRLVYYAMGGWPPDGPEWVLVHSQETPFLPPETFPDKSGNEYRLQAVFPYAGLSGWHWAVYRNGNRRGGPATGPATG